MRRTARAAVGAVLLLFAGAGSAASEGAFAVGSTGDVVGKGMAFGWSYNYATRGEAIDAAMRTCRESGATDASAQCMVIATYRNECLAVAIDPQGPRVGQPLGRLGG